MLVWLLGAAGCAVRAPDVEPVRLAEPPPATEVWIVDLGGTIDDPAPRVERAVDASRRPGYDNQPAFLDAERLLWVAIGDDGQADVVLHDVGRKATRPLTRTAESEFSPTPLPGGDGFSVVRVEPDMRQRLWAFDGSGARPRLLLPDVEPVGYHAWLDGGHAILFVLGEPPTLQLVALEAPGSPRALADAPGRSLASVPGRSAASFVGSGASGARILEVDRTGEIRDRGPALVDAEHHAWTPGGALLMTRGSSIHRRAAGAERWEEIFDLEVHGVRGITRLAVAPGGRRLAVVAEE